MWIETVLTGVVTVTVSGPPGARQAAPVQVQIEARSDLAGASTISRPLLVARGGTAETTFSLSPGSWTIHATAAGYWSPPKEIEIGDEPAGVTLRLYETALVSRRVERLVADDAKLHVAFRSSPNALTQQKVPEGNVSCPIKGQQVSCEVPVGTLDVRFEVPGFVPEYLWSQPILPGRTNALPPLPLSKGASISGFVRTADDKPVRDALVELLTQSGQGIVASPKRESSGVAVNLAESGRRPLQATTNGRGFFQIRGAPAGEFQLAARSATLVGTTTVRTQTDREARLRDFLVLEEPLELSVSFEPALAPGGTPWTLRVVRLEPFAGEVHRRPAKDGHITVSPITRGRYSLEVWKDGDRWFVESVAIDGPPPPVVIRMPSVTVGGTLTLARKPLKGTLVFGGVGGPISVSMESDAEGKFQGVLPRDGDWVVSVEATEPRVQRKLSQVPVRASPTGEAEIAIDLPDTVLRGRVVDEAGTGVRALVAVTPTSAEDLRFQVSVEPGHSFELHGLAEGELALAAIAEESRRSDVQFVHVAEGQKAETTLVVRDARMVRGRLRSPDGTPIAGGTVFAFETLGQGGRYLRTDADGRFTISLTPGVAALTVVYWADGYALGLSRLRVSEAPLDLVLTPAGGSLVLDFGREVNLLVDAPFHVVLQNGAAQLPVARLAMFAARRRLADAPRAPKTVGIELSGMSPGDYAVCLQGRADLVAGRPAPGPCDRGTLTPGGILRLSLPPKAWPATSKD